MPKDSSRSNFERDKARAKLRKDRPDLRDLDYEPTLQPLKRILMPPDRLTANTFKVRSQTDEKGNDYSDCTGQALAALYDIVSTRASSQVSARMLFVNGHEVEHVDRGLPTNQDPKLTEGLQSLRSIIKGFYHNGVCEDEIYRGERLRAGAKTSDLDLAKSIAITKDARNRPLGSYYRLKPILNDYHAALNEVGAILAAAEIHEGWTGENVKKNGGTIDPSLAATGEKFMHAFVIVGYTERGFLVLNSWGKDWGNFAPNGAEQQAYLETFGKKAKLPAAYPGVALWTYRDWAERILDGWVLRFGVSAPQAFEFSYGEQGLRGFAEGAISAPSIQRYKIAGHYVHLDDGDFVKAGTLPSTPDQISTTVEFLNSRFSGKDTGLDEDGKPKQVYRDVLLWIAGGSESTKEVAADIGATKDYWKNHGIYPITVFWCSDFIEKTTELLASTFKSSLEKIGREGEDLDIRIEQDCRGPGRAFWRDIEWAAERAARRDTIHDAAFDIPAGGFMQTFELLRKLDPGIRVHVVAEGAGAILLSEFLGECAAHKDDNEYCRIASITLVAPACTRIYFERLMLKWRRDARGIRPASRPIDLFVLDQSTDKRMKLGSYGGSILRLVQNSFVEKPPERKVGSAGKIKASILSETDPRSEVIGLLEAARRLARGEYKDDVALYVWSGAGEGKIAKLRDVTFSKQARDNILYLVTDGKAGLAPVADREKGREPERPAGGPAASHGAGPAAHLSEIKPAPALSGPE